VKHGMRFILLDVTLTWYLSIHFNCQCQHGGYMNVQGRSDISNTYPGVFKLYMVMYLQKYAASVKVICLQGKKNKRVAPRNVFIGMFSKQLWTATTDLIISVLTEQCDPTRWLFCEI
jgi:hypothetical protein